MDLNEKYINSPDLQSPGSNGDYDQNNSSNANTPGIGNGNPNFKNENYFSYVSTTSTYPDNSQPSSLSYGTMQNQNVQDRATTGFISDNNNNRVNARFGSAYTPVLAHSTYMQDNNPGSNNSTTMPHNITHASSVYALGLSAILANAPRMSVNENASDEFLNEKLKNLRDKKIKIRIKNPSGLNSSRIDASIDQIGQESHHIPLQEPDYSRGSELGSLRQSYVISAEKPSEYIGGSNTPSTTSVTNSMAMPISNNNNIDSMPTGPINIHRRKNNPLFWSTATGIERKSISSEVVDGFDIGGKTLQQQQQKTASEEEQETRKEEMKKEIAKLLFQKEVTMDMSKIEQIHRAKTKGPSRDRKDNPLFYSTMSSVQKKPEIIQRNDTIFEEFLIPKNVSKMLEDEVENIRVVEHYITQEKYKVSIDMDQILSDIGDVLNAHRVILNNKLDDFLEKYKNNYVILKEKVQQFKEKTKLFYNENQDLLGKTNTQQTFNPILKSIQYFKISKGEDNIATPIKLKEEASNLQINVSLINREVGKKHLLLLTEEMQKQAQDLPAYNHTESMQLSFSETKADLVEYTRQKYEKFSEEMITVPKHDSLSCLYAFPKIEAQISDDYLSVVGDSEKLINLTLSIEKFAGFGNIQDHFTCMHALPGDIVAIGSSSGFIRLWNYVNDQNYGMFQAQGGPVTAILPMKVQLGDINDLVLLTAGAAPDCIIRAWTFPAQKCVRALKGHKDSISSLLPLRDGITLLSSSRESEIYVWNMATGKLFNKIAHHTGPINALLLLKDNMHFISGSSDQSFCVWKINYSYSTDYNRRMFSSCDLLNKFVDSCEILALNSATTNPFLVLTGGSDSKIKIWNIEADQCIQEIDAHENGISEIMYFENPFKLEWDDNFLILSLSFEDDSIVMSKSSFAKGLIAAKDDSICIDKGFVAHHRMQIVKGKDGNMRILVLGKQSHRGVIVWTFEDNY